MLVIFYFTLWNGEGKRGSFDSTLVMQWLLASFCKIILSGDSGSSSQANGDWRRYRFPKAASLQTLQSVDCTVEGSLGRSFCAEKSV